MHPILSLFLEEWLQVLIVTLVDVVFRGIRRHVLRILIRTIRLLLSSQLVNARWIFVKLLQLFVLFERCQVFSLWRVSKLGSCVHWGACFGSQHSFFVPGWITTPALQCWLVKVTVNMVSEVHRVVVIVETTLFMVLIVLFYANLSTALFLSSVIDDWLKGWICLY